MSFLEAFAIGFPTNMWILFAVCLVLSSIGFYKFVYFLSIGYGFAISGCGLALLLMFGFDVGLAMILECILFIAYGIRLGGFLLVRELKNATYRKTLDEATKTQKPIPFFVKAVIWIVVSALYVAQVSPVYYRLCSGKYSSVIVYVGIGISILALIIESISDKQKSNAKKINPKRFCDSGLFKIVRCPNYFGEILFWTGVFISGIGSYQSYIQWIVAIIAYISIIYIMFSGAKRLEKRQNSNYGKDPEYQDYVKKTPIILPLIPIKSLASWNFIKI